jgi:hypothetical protein
MFGADVYIQYKAALGNFKRAGAVISLFVSLAPGLVGDDTGHFMPNLSTGFPWISAREWASAIGSVRKVGHPLRSTRIILIEEPHDLSETSGRVCLVARPGAVTLDRVAQQYARAVTGIGTDQLWAALRQWGAATLTGREGL